MSEALFELKQVRYSYQGRFPALEGLDLSIHAGQMVALMGANGSGKSTLLNLLDALIFADSGSLLYLGRELKERDLEDEAFSLAFRRQVGLVFQNPDAQLFCPTVREDIAFGPLQLGVGLAEVEARVSRLSQELGIAHLLDRAPHQLSLGERRKVAFASTLAVDSQVLLLDEPTAGLDPATAAHLLEMLLKASAQGKTIVTATHDIHIVEDISDMVYVFGQDRRIAGQGSPQQVMADTALLKACNLIHAHPHRHQGQVHAHPHQHLEHHA
jgi:cobalt/nickel transport system ATP-binding protein